MEPAPPGLTDCGATLTLPSEHQDAAVQGSLTSGLGGRLHIVWLLNEELSAGVTVNQLISTKCEELKLSCRQVAQI